MVVDGIVKLFKVLIISVVELIVFDVFAEVLAVLSIVLKVILSLVMLKSGVFTDNFEVVFTLKFKK